MSINLWPNMPLEREGENAGCPSMTPYLLEGEGPYPVMIVCPGGGYRRRADHEGEPVARWLNGLGISAFVLHYRVAPFQYPNALQDALRAIRTVRYYASEWKLDPARVGILGFSAGGHLASTAGTFYDLGNEHAEDPIEQESGRPDLMVLCYPVITFKGEFAHEGSRANLLGERQSDPSMVELLSTETRITPETPPAFIWHTADDEAVGVENAFMFAAGLRRNKIPFDLHIFDSGRHGIGLAGEHREAKAWPSICEKWFKRRGFI
jgi:acetyl esterase/lipase